VHQTPTLYHITDIFLPANQLTKKPGFFSITDSQKPGFSPKSLVVTDKLTKKPGFFSITDSQSILDFRF